MTSTWLASVSSASCTTSCDIEEDSLSVVLSLLDQLYATRRSLRTLMAAVEAQPGDVRARIADLVKAER